MLALSAFNQKQERLKSIYGNKRHHTNYLIQEAITLKIRVMNILENPTLKGKGYLLFFLFWIRNKNGFSLESSHQSPTI